MIPIKCKKCQHEWTYKGQAIYYAQCPKCRKNINIIKTIKELNQKEQEQKRRGITIK